MAGPVLYSSKRGIRFQYGELRRRLLQKRDDWHIPAVLVGLLVALGSTRGAAGELQIRTNSAGWQLQVVGSGNDDWRLQGSSNLLTWSTLTNFGTLLSGHDTNAPWRSLTTTHGPEQFYRALKTAGLYDPTLFRTVSLTFTQANWSTLLASGRTTGSNVYCSAVVLDNGATNHGAGARYKGNTSYTLGGAKKSLNVELDYTDPAADLMGYTTFNLNNAAGDRTLMREAVYFTVMSQYTPCPKGAMARVQMNGGVWGVYSLVQQENGQLIDEWFSSNNGDRWRTPNAPMGGGGFAGSNSALSYLSSTNQSTYQPHYDLRTTNSPSAVAWRRLINAITVLNTTPTNQLRERVEDVLAVDRWLWFLAIENVFADDDSYWNKGADYSFYYEPESGRIHPVEHDGNEAFILTDAQLSPVVGSTGGNRPLLHRLLPINELRQRYLAHMRTVLEEYYNPTVLFPMLDNLQTLSLSAIAVDTNKNFQMLDYSNAVAQLRSYIVTRNSYLTNHAELRPPAPDILTVSGPSVSPTAVEIPFVTAEVAAAGTNGIDSVWLYHRGHSYGRFTAVEMLDDGQHNDGASGDGVFGAATTNYPAGTRVRYYVEARSATPPKAARFLPARAEQQSFSYRVAVTTASNSPVILNEIMASNASTLADPQGEFDDWIELRNLTDQPVELTGRYLSDEPNNPRKWAFPAGTTLPADGYLLIWADEDGAATPGLHASFKLSASEGERLFLTDTDANLNAILDTVEFGALPADRAYGRTSANPDTWEILDPTPGQANP
jgi:spore coat protein CotH